ncbi:uncharacterized protein LOC127804321 [Diospyros lotus]|uniref:uncharacterized protein LOC127804321 n=1 Tax=Diospyros lotus TaxID=55363 RepID=UPI002250FC61|nr:uncharacterized protein LOC127804321 [Diospyros lotus]
MAFKMLVSLVRRFINLGRRPRIKNPSSFEAVAASIVADIVMEGANEDPGDELCCVCLSRFKEGEDARVLPCLHEFHRVCIDRWFDLCRKTCPVCRFLVEEEEKFPVKEALTDEMVIWFSSFHVAGF